VELADFIVGEPAAAVEAAIEALAKLQVAVHTQHRRLTYLPRGRRREGEASRPARTRVIAGDAQLLQRLVYAETEPFERRQERSGAVDSHALQVRFVKHLVRITLGRNSFYVALAVSRLLHRYSTAAAMDLYGLLVQDPDRVRDDHYYRSRKKQLLAEVLDRFDGLVSVETGPRGERRLRTAPPDPATAALARECLRRFTPWDTPCVVPEGLDQWSTDIPELRFDGRDADGEHPVEMRRIHAVLHPPCHARLLRALSLPSPDEHLALPEFQMRNDDGSHGGRRGAGPATPSAPTAEEEWTRARQRLESEAWRRRDNHARLLVVLADGRERASLDLLQGRGVRVRLEDGVEQVEVRDGADGTLLALWLAASGDATERRVTLESGREIAIQAEPAADGAGLEVTVTCRETRPLPAARWWWARTGVRAAGRLAPARAALATLAVAAGVAALLPQRAEVGLPRQPPPPPASGSPQPSPSRPAVATPSVAPLPSPSGPAAAPRPEDRIEGPERTRGPAPAAPLALADVRRVHVDPLGSDAFTQALRAELGLRLSAPGCLEVVPQRRGADAVLKAERGEGGSLALELVDAAGRVLWTGRAGGGPGTAAAEADRAAKALCAARDGGG
jgi:hypothetical protein